MLNNWGELCRSTGRLARAEELLTRAYEEISPDQRAQHPSLLHNLGLLRRAQGDLPRARELLTRAVEGHNASGFDPDSLDTLAALAGVCMDLNELEEAERRLNEGLNRAGQHRLSKAIAEFRSLQGDLARHRGRPLEALPHYQFALEEARARRHPVDEGTARHQIGLAHLEADQLDLAAAAFQAAVGLSRGAGDRPGATLSSALLGSALLKAGRADEAVRWLAPAAEALREIGNRANERTARLDLAAALHRLGRGAESAEALAHGLELTRELHGERAAQVARIQFVAQLREQSPGSEVAPDGPRSHEVLARVMGETRQAGDRHGEAELFLQESLAALQGDDPDGAITSARRAAELAGELGATHLEGAARTNLGEGLRRGGRPEEAVEEFGRAIALLEAGGNPNSLADAHNNLGLALMEGGRWAEAVPHLEETVRLKRQIGRPGGAAVAERLLAQACQQLEQFAACAEHARAAAALFRQAGRPECVPELLLTSAAARAELDDPTAAAADLEQAAAAAREIGSAPELATALAMRGVLLGFRLDRPDEGAAALEEAAGLAHDLGLTGEQLGGMTPDGLREAAQRLRTGRASAAFEAGEEAFGRGEWAAAAERFEQALALGHASARIALSAVACSAADLDAASAHLAAALTAHPDDADALYWLGQVSFRRGRYEEGLRAVRQAVAVRQQQGTLAAPEPTKLVTATTGGVMARYYQHREPPRITPDYLALHLARANLAAAFGDHAAALADLAHLLEIQPNRSEYYFLRAQVWVALGRPADAARDLYQATELEPHHRRLYEVRAGIFVGAGDPAGALEDYGWALRLDPDVAATWADRGWALLTLGDFAEAADDFREAAACDPGNAEHPFWAGVALALGGDLSGAVAELDRSPPDAVPDVWRALVALKQQDAGRAAGLLRGWLDRRPDDPVVLFWLGLVERVGSTPNAETYLRRAGERAGAGADGDQARLRGRLAVLAGDAGGALACCAEVASTCPLLAMRLEVGFLDWPRRVVSRSARGGGRRRRPACPPRRAVVFPGPAEHQAMSPFAATGSFQPSPTPVGGRFVIDRTADTPRCAVGLGYDRGDQRPVALYCPARWSPEAPSLVARWRSVEHGNVWPCRGWVQIEGRTALALDHPAADWGRPWALARRVSGARGRPSLAQIIDWTFGICEGLMALAGVGLTHGGLCPETILIVQGGWPCLAFPGLADNVADGADLTPYRLAGAPPSAAGDLYAVGGLLWFLLTGRPARGAVDGLDPDCAAVADRCLTDDPSRRYADLGALVADLSRLAASRLGRLPRKAPAGADRAAWAAAARGSVLTRLRRYEQAEDEFARAGDLAVAHVNRAWQDLVLNAPELAARNVAAALRLDPENAEARAYLGEIVSTADPAEGLAAFARAIELDPSAARAYSARAVLRARLKEHTGAAEDLLAARELAPDDAIVHFHAAVAAEHAADVAAAAQFYRAAVAAEPTFAPARARLGRLLEEGGQPREAEQEFTRALRDDPACGTGWYHRGRLHERQGRATAALPDYTRAVEMLGWDPLPT